MFTASSSVAESANGIVSSSFCATQTIFGERGVAPPEEVTFRFSTQKEVPAVFASKIKSVPESTLAFTAVCEVITCAKSTKEPLL